MPDEFKYKWMPYGPKTYDQIAPWYLTYALSQPSPREQYTHKLLSSCPPSPHILELGCGPGVPTTRLLLDSGAHVTANDISPTQLRLTATHCPTATLILGDMVTLSFAPNTFSGVVAFYSLFHVPRNDQPSLLSNIATWLKPGGIFVANFATLDEEEIYGEIMGHGMFWSSFCVERNVKMVEDAGLEVLDREVREAGDGKLDEGEPDHGVSFLWVRARKGGAES